MHYHAAHVMVLDVNGDIHSNVVVSEVCITNSMMCQRLELDVVQKFVEATGVGVEHLVTQYYRDPAEAVIADAMFDNDMVTLSPEMLWAAVMAFTNNHKPKLEH